MGFYIDLWSGSEWTEVVEIYKVYWHIGVEFFRRFKGCWLDAERTSYQYGWRAEGRKYNQRHIRRWVDRPSTSGADTTVLHWVGWIESAQTRTGLVVQVSTFHASGQPPWSSIHSQCSHREDWGYPTTPVLNPIPKLRI